MVKIIDGYKEITDNIQKYEQAYNLAQQVFNKRISGRGDSSSSITIRGINGTGCPVLFYPLVNLIKVSDESDLERALKLAELAEKKFGKEIELVKTYPPKTK